ncbi:hypothetical protein CAPTEDRAFT_194524 [Capitella teleta]|uniref:Chitin-binding type-2 domain-containing protein n=1 Tax=Capitella teleta TaxID=283909 RepID=R7T8X9_CAPTE|nr:hypothetical protein CAPTEDRAFT_194524 [Capitella teleta]|eukprot:ELT87855.1 hypothetical protein CAPTEDRAFT_194524 [Capitella teleta]
MELIWRILIICIAVCVSSAFPPRRTFVTNRRPNKCPNGCSNCCPHDTDTWNCSARVGGNNFGSAPGYGSVWNPSANTWQGGNGASLFGGSGSGTPAGQTAHDARNGHYYYECISDLSGGGRWIHRACALGSIFNHVTGNCGRKDAKFHDDSVISSGYIAG